MRSRYNIIAVLVFHCSLLIVNCSLSFAQWSTDPNVNLQVSSWGQYPVACTDGEGGVYIRWEQNSYTTAQYIQHVNKYGYIQWPTPVEVYGTQNGTVFEGKICPDDSNGVIVLFTEWNVNGDDPQYFTHKRVRVNRLDSNGNKLWGEYGVRVSMRDTSQALREIVTDGQKGCIVAFLVTPDSLYVQRISSIGQRMWGEEGIFVHKLGTYGEISAVTDCNNGIILNYWESTTQTTRFQRRNGNGDTLWTKISATPYTLMKSDGYGGLLLSMNRYNYGEDRIIVNRMNSDGTFIWGNYGITISDTINNYTKITDMYINNKKEIIAVYQKSLNGQYPEIFTQKIDSNGILIWEDNHRISYTAHNRSNCKLIQSDNDNTISIWLSTGAMIYGQKLDSLGNQLWSVNDNPLTYHNTSGKISAVSDFNHGAICVWEEAPLNGVFAQQINKEGFIGNVIHIQSSEPIKPLYISLYQNYPNPFNNTTSIKYQIFKNDEIEIKLFNILGQEVITLYKGYQQSGLHSINLDMKNLSSGVYVYRLKSSSGTLSRKMIYIK